MWVMAVGIGQQGEGGYEDVCELHCESGTKTKG